MKKSHANIYIDCKFISQNQMQISLKFLGLVNSTLRIISVNLKIDSGLAALDKLTVENLLADAIYQL